MKVVPLGDQILNHLVPTSLLERLVKEERDESCVGESTRVFISSEIFITLYSEKKTSQELRMLSTVTLDCQVTKIVMNLGSQL